MTNKKVENYTDYYIEDPPVLFESFKHAIHLLIERFQQWDTLLTALHNYFETQKNTINTLCNTYQDAIKSLNEAFVKPSVINSMNIHEETQEVLSIKRAKVKLDAVTQKFIPFGHKFNFDYSKHGGVLKNINRLKEHAEQMALLAEKRREFLLNNTLTNITNLKTETVGERQKQLKDWSDHLNETMNIQQKAIAAYRQMVIV